MVNRPYFLIIVLLSLVASLLAASDIASSSQNTFLLAKLVGYHDLESAGENANLDVLGNYVAVGHSRQGIRIIDVSDKTNPKLIGRYRSSLTGNLTEPRLADLDADGQPDIMIVNLQLGNGTGGIEIVDITDPSKPRKIASTDNITVHNLVISGSGTADRSDDYVYLATSHPNEGFQGLPLLPKGAEQLRIYKISDPKKPLKVGGWTADYKPKPGEFVTIHDISIRDNRAYLSYWDAGLYILDISEPTSPKQLGWIDYSPPDEGNTHNAISTPAGNIVFIGDEIGFLEGETGIGGIRVIDVSQLPNLRQIAHYKPGFPNFDTRGLLLSGTRLPDSIQVGGALPDGSSSYTAHNFDLSPDGNVLFAAFYNAGLHIIDVSKPSQPRLMQRFYPMRLFDSRSPIVPAFWGAIYRDGYVYIADINNGLWILQIAEIPLERTAALPSKFGVEIPNIRGQLSFWATGYFPKVGSEMTGSGNIAFDLRTGNFRLEVEGLPRLKSGGYEAYMLFETAEGIQDSLNLGNFNTDEAGKAIREFHLKEDLIHSGRYFNTFSIYRMPTLGIHENLLKVQDAIQVLMTNGDMTGLVPRRESFPSLKDFDIYNSLPRDIGIEKVGVRGKIPFVVKETFNPKGLGSGTVAFDLSQGVIEVEVSDLPRLESGTYEAYLTRFEPNGKLNSSGFVEFMSLGSFNTGEDDGSSKGSNARHIFYSGEDLTPKGFNLFLIYKQQTAGIHPIPEAENYADILGNNSAVLAANLTSKDGNSVFNLRQTISVKGKLTSSLGQIKSWALLQNFPNPFNAETWIPFQLLQTTSVSIKITNSQGKLVRTLNLGRLQAGDYSMKSRAAYWDGKNDSGEDMASGIYFYSIQAEDFVATRKLIIIK